MYMIDEIVINGSKILQGQGQRPDMENWQPQQRT